MDVIRNVKFFKDKKDQLKDIATAFTFQRNASGEKIIQYGEYGDQFYIIIQGKVSVEIPNPVIRAWKDEFKKYSDLQAWHKSVIERKIWELRKDIPS